jgi:hypothetical protein
MTLALLVEPIRHPRRVLGIVLITPRAGCTSTPAVAGTLAFPRLMGMVLTHPAAVLAEARARVRRGRSSNETYHVAWDLSAMMRRSRGYAGPQRQT